MKNKKAIVFVSMIMILIYHLWISVTNSIFEQNIRKLLVIGVDLFFFISAYSISNVNALNYKTFIYDRLKKIYIKFIVFTIIYSIYNMKSIVFIIRTILGIDFLTRGGGSFLWFIPAIMIIYILLPIYNITYKKVLSLVCAFTMYILLLVVALNNTNFNQLLILINRIPIILMGYYTCKYDMLKHADKSRIAPILLMIFGLSISLISLSKIYWIKDFQYIINIPLEISLIIILNRVPYTKIISMVSEISLEVYALQMMIGFKIASRVLKIFNYPVVSNIITMIIVILLAYTLNKIYIALINQMKRILDVNI